MTDSIQQLYNIGYAVSEISKILHTSQYKVRRTLYENGLVGYPKADSVIPDPDPLLKALEREHGGQSGKHKTI